MTPRISRGELRERLAAKLPPDPDSTDVRVYDGGNLDWFNAGLPMEGIRAAG